MNENFILKTKYNRENIGGHKLDWSAQPEIYKTYKDAERIKLPEFKEIEVSFFKLLKERKSHRNYNPNKVLLLTDLSFILWATNGIQRIEFGYEFRTIPSAGALYPIEIYLYINNVENLKKGIYHYNVKEHSLEILKIGDFTREIVFALLHQSFVKYANVIFIFSAIFYRTLWKYRERGYRYILIEAGHAAQNLSLSAEAIGAGVCHIGAFFDDELNNLIMVDGENESVIYVTSLGYPL